MTAADCTYAFPPPAPKRGCSGFNSTASAATWGLVPSPISRSLKPGGARQITGTRGATVVDPLAAKTALRRAQRVATAKGRTFKECAVEYIEKNRAGWRNAKHRQQWENTLATYAHPTLGELPVSAIDTGLVVQVLDPIWTEKSETASRVRGRIEAILDAATVRGFRQGPNPAQWKGNLAHVLPAPSKVRKVEHHAALPFDDVSEFLPALRGREGMAARALEFAILTAARTGEVLGARWGEIDFDARVWVVPSKRMKSGREHRVPLSDAALALLENVRPLGLIRDGAPDPTAPVFPGTRRVLPLSNMVFLMLLRRMKRTDLTAHGFRSTFSDWAAERTGYPREVVEMALAHTVESKVERAYRRGDLFEKRRQLMDAWARFCEAPPAGKVVPLRAGG
jgi:integrase